MPKQKLSKKNDAAYQGSQRRLERSKAPQAAAHRRGGTHKVRDEDKTNSIYDTYNYRELVDAAKERGIYRKDMKKVEMAWTLKRNDGEKKRAERDNLIALWKKQQQAKREQERIAAEKEELLKAKRRRKREKMRKRERDESVSDDTASEAELEAAQEARGEYQREAIGQVLSDTSWDSSFTESVSDANSADQMLKPSCKLQLLEWPHQTMPPVEPDSSTPHFLDPQPRQTPYAPLKITTTLSKHKLCLPGLKYPPTVDPDFVPLLPPAVRTAAHKGRLEGILHNASIETGEEWASRTLVHGSNATLYFHPSNVSDSTKSLASVYDKWSLEKTRLRRVNAKCEASPAAREERRRHKKRYRSSMMAEVYEACKWRPGAVGYIPAYLDFETRARNGDKDEPERSLENLRFVRFNGCDVPHYYFWISDTQESKEDEELDEVHQRAMVGARKRPYKAPQLSPDHEPCGEETPIKDETEGVLREIGSDSSAEGLFGKASPTFILSKETDGNHSIAQWLEHVKPSCDAPLALVSLSEPLDIVGSDEKDELHSGKEALSPISEHDMGEECTFWHMPWAEMPSEVRLATPPQ